MTDGTPSNRPSGQLTVVIPHYNHITLLPRSIASVLDQNIEGIEILVVDDGSRPECQKTLDYIAETQPTVRVIRHSVNRGAPAALNTGLAAAQGAAISFLGADDLALPGLYSSMLAALERYPQAAFACGEIAIVGDDGRVRGVRPLTAPAVQGGYLSPDLVKRRIRTTDNWICNTTTVYHTEVLRRWGGFDESLGAFCDGYTVRLLAFEKGFVFVPGLFGVWRVAADTLSASSALQLDKSIPSMQRAVAHLSRSPIATAAPDYPATFARRQRFSAARLHFVWHRANADPHQVCETAGLGSLDLRLLSGIKRGIGFGSVGRALALAWAAARLRPFGPLQLAMHMVRNRLLLWRNAERVSADILRVERLGNKLTPSGGAA